MVEKYSAHNKCMLNLVNTESLSLVGNSMSLSYITKPHTKSVTKGSLYLQCPSLMPTQYLLHNAYNKYSSPIKDICIYMCTLGRYKLLVEVQCI